MSVRTVQNIERGKPTLIGTVLKVAFALGVEPKDCILRAVTATENNASGANGPAGSAAEIPDCPYRGLLPFREKDEHLLFGREQLLVLLQGKIGHKSVIQVSGPSGSGKSSLIAAGLIPAIKRLVSWHVLSCRPGSDPFGSLAGALIPHLEPELNEISRAARLPELSRVIEGGQLSYLLPRLLSEPSHSLFIFVDQFEELYTQCASQEVRRRYLDALLNLARAGQDGGRRQITVVYTIRADFANRLLSYREFIDAIQDGDVKIGPMTREELDSAIRKPALCRGVRFEAGLVERILNDAGIEPGTLPLLEFALTELWEKQIDRVLTHTAYDEVGQLSGAIAKRAETIFRSLTPLEQESARRILTQLVRIAEDGGDDTRQRAYLGLLYAQEQINSETGRKVLDVLTAARLVTVGLGDDVRKGEAVEIAHEALIRRWPRFGQWLAEDREILVWRQRTRMLINRWQETARDDGLLLRGPLLDEAKLWLARRPTELSASERDFVAASVAARNKERVNRPIQSFEVLLDDSGGELATSGARLQNTRPDAPLVGEEVLLDGHRDLWRLQINIIPVLPAQARELRGTMPQVRASDLLPLLSTARPQPWPRGAPEVTEPTELPRKLDESTLSLVRRLQVQATSGLALELLTPQLDGIRDPALRLQFGLVRGICG